MISNNGTAPFDCDLVGIYVIHVDDDREARESMLCSECLFRWRERNEAMQARLIRSTQDLDDEALNRSPDSQTWSPVQVLQHMVLAHGPYLRTIQSGLEHAARSADDRPVRHSWFGKIVIRAVNPDSNVPAPRNLQPGPRPVWQEVYTEWQHQYDQLLSLINDAKGVDLSGVIVRNPFIGVFRQNLADCIEIVTAHIERHVGQIEERVPRSAVVS